MSSAVNPQTIGKLMVAGIVAGLLAAAAYCIFMVATVRLRPELAPRRMGRASWSERWVSLRGTWAIVVLFLVVMGGTYLGFFSPTAKLNAMYQRN